MRDIKDYENKYIDEINEFERYKVIYRRKKVIEIIEKFSPQSILEIGCGMEPLFCYVNNKRFIIVEPSKLFYNNAVNLSGGSPNIVCINDFFENIVEKYEQEWEGVDMIICSGLLHEVSEPRSLLSAIRRICKEETVVHIEVPNANSMHRLLGVEMSLIEDIYSKSENNIRLQQNTNFDMDQLKKIVEESGMKIIEEGSLFIKPFSHKQMGEMCKCGIIDEYVLDGLYNLTKYMPQFGSEIFVNCVRT